MVPRMCLCSYWFPCKSKSCTANSNAVLFFAFCTGPVPPGKRFLALGRAPEGVQSLHLFQALGELLITGCLQSSSFLLVPSQSRGQGCCIFLQHQLQQDRLWTGFSTDSLATNPLLTLTTAGTRHQSLVLALWNWRSSQLSSPTPWASGFPVIRLHSGLKLCSGVQRKRKQLLSFYSREKQE